MKLEDFYKDIIHSFGLEEDDGYIKAGGEKVIIKERPLVLPTKHHLDTAIENGVAIKYVFNILAENVASVRLDLQYLVKVMNVNFNITIAQMLSNIIEKFYSSLDDLNSDMIELLSECNKAKGSAKKLVDDNTIKLLHTLIEKPNFVQLKLVRSVKRKDEKLKFGIKVKSPIIEYLNSDEIVNDKDWKRRKDRDLFKILLDFLIGEIINEVIGSNHNKAPDALAVLKFNLNASEYFQSLADDLGLENLYPKCKYSAKQLSDKIINVYIAKAHLIIDIEEFLFNKKETSSRKSTKTIRRKPFGTVEVDEGTYEEPARDIPMNVHNSVEEEPVAVNRPINNLDIIAPPDPRYGNIYDRGYGGYINRDLYPRGRDIYPPRRDPYADPYNMGRSIYPPRRDPYMDPYYTERDREPYRVNPEDVRPI